MLITLYRFNYSPQSTISRVYVDGVFECYALEDTVRPDGVKVYGATAIPAGTYPLIINHSPHFGCDLPLLCAVPNFEGVRIHPGNTPADTEGCILPGIGFGNDVVTESRKAFDALFAKINAAVDRGEAVNVEITA